MSKNLINLSVFERLKFLMKDSLIYGSAAALSKAFGLISFPLIARTLSVADFGFYDYLISLVVFITILIQFGQDSSIARFYYEYENKKKRQQLISQSLFFQFFCFIIFLILILTNSEYIKNYILLEKDTDNILLLLAINIPFQLLISFAQNILRWSFKRNEFLFMSLAYTFFQTLLIVLLILFDAMTVKNLFSVYIICNIVFAIFGLIFIRKYIIIINNYNGFKEILFFALPYGLIGILIAMGSTLERNLTHNYLGENALGFYAAAFKIAILTSLLVNAFHTAWGPFSLSLYKDKNVIKTYNLVLKTFSIFLLISILILTLASPIIIKILASQKYLSVVNLVFPLALAVGIRGISWITEIGITISKKSYLSIISHSVQFFSTICLIIILSNKFGLTGVAISVLTGQILRSIIESYYAQKVYPMNWDYNPIIKLLLITIFIGLFSEIIRNFYGDLLTNFSYLFGIIFLIYFSKKKLFSSLEREKIILFVNQSLNKIAKQ